MRLYLIILMMVFSDSVFAFDFKGIEIGSESSWATIGNTLSIQCNDGGDGVWCNGKTTILGSDAEVFVSMNKESIIQSISITFKPEKFEDIAKTYITKYGKPSKVNKKVLSNALGVSFNQIEMTWKSKDTTLLLKKYNNSIAEGSIWMVTEDKMKKLMLDAVKDKTDI